MARMSTVVANQLVKAMGIKRRLEHIAAVDDDPEQLAELVAKIRRTDRPEPSRRLRRHWNIESRDVAGYALHVMTRPEGRSGRIILYLHGGGYMFGPFPTEWAACHRVATGLGCDFAILVYPKAPEHRAPETIRVVKQSYLQLDAEYGDGAVIVMGTSAGGALAVGLMADLRDGGSRLPESGVLLSPGVDMTLSEPIGDLEDRDVLLSTAHVRSAGALYAGDLGADHPSVSPINADLSGLPRLQVFAGTHEILYPSLLTFVERARAAGADVELVVGEGQQHTWPLAPTPDGRAALRQIVDFIGGETG